MNHLKNKTIFITGASRGIGKAIALKCAKDGANIVIAAKTTTPNDKLEGTIYSVAEEVDKAGGKALPLKLDVRNEDEIQACFAEAQNKFGGIDVLINNASAISMTPTLDTPMKRFDLMFSVNVRATFACSQAAIPYLKKSQNPHILNLSPPLNLAPKWFKNHLAYTMSKYGMSMCTLGLAEELKQDGIAVNSLWPKTTIATAAISVHFPEHIFKASRKPEIMADAAYFILTSDAKTTTGNFFIDENVLVQHGIQSFEEYAITPNANLFPDLFLENNS